MCLMSFSFTGGGLAALPGEAAVWWLGKWLGGAQEFRTGVLQLEQVVDAEG